MSKKTSLENPIRDYVHAALGDQVFEVTRLANMARNDLYDEGNDYPGFTKTCKLLTDLLADIADLWVDEDSGCVTSHDPAGDPDDDSGYRYRFDRRNVLRIYLGTELAGYV